MAAIESHLVPPHRDIVTHDKWKAGYNSQLAIGYRDARADPNLRFGVRGYWCAIVECGALH